MRGGRNEDPRRGSSGHLVGDSGDVLPGSDGLARTISQESRGQGVSGNPGALRSIRVLGPVLEGHRRGGPGLALRPLLASGGVLGSCGAPVPS